MVSQAFAQGDKTLGIIIGPKYYNFKQLIGTHFGVPLKRYDVDIVKHLITISTFERLDGKKLKKAEVLEQCLDILEASDTMGIGVLLVANSEYFKVLTNGKGFEDSIGECFQCALANYEHIKILPCINPAVLNAQPNKKGLLDKAIRVCGEVLTGKFEKQKAFEFESYELITDITRAKEVFALLNTKGMLATDIETTGLRLGEAEVLTIAFAWDTHNAVTFACHANYSSHSMIRELKSFFESYKGETVYHNGLFDLKHLIYNWWMSTFSDLDGLYKGCEALGVDRTHDSMLLAYAELNSTERPPLGLKVLAKEFMGEWAEDTKDCTKIPLEDLARYNAKDVCATFWVYEKFKHQRESRGYLEILQPSIEPLLHMMINGLPIDMARVEDASSIITGELDKAIKDLSRDGYVEQTVGILKEMATLKYNASHVKQKESWEFDLEFNPNSSNQLRVLLYDVMKFDPIEFTETGAPKTDRASLKEFRMLLQDDDDKFSTLQALQTVSETAIIQSTFLSAFIEMSLPDVDDNYTLHGNLRLGGTQSGRLSSSEPNLQNLPSGSIYGKAIKNCFIAPEGWLFAFSDFSALNYSGAMAA